MRCPEVTRNTRFDCARHSICTKSGRVAPSKLTRNPSSSIRARSAGSDMRLPWRPKKIVRCLQNHASMISLARWRARHFLANLSAKSPKRERNLADRAATSAGFTGGRSAYSGSDFSWQAYYETLRTPKSIAACFAVAAPCAFRQGEGHVSLDSVFVAAPWLRLVRGPAAAEEARRLLAPEVRCDARQLREAGR